jgi:hypothetical protein
MRDQRLHDAVSRLLRLLGERLDAHADGDPLAFETLGERIEEAHLGDDDIRAAAMVIRALADGPVGDFECAVEDVPGERAERVLSAEERASLSPEAWGYLIALRRRGSLDPGQIERVLEALTGCGVRPVSVDLARDVAARVALDRAEFEDGRETHGDVEIAH